MVNVGAHQSLLAFISEETPVERSTIRALGAALWFAAIPIAASSADDASTTTLSLIPSTPSVGNCRSALEQGRILEVRDGTVIVFWGYHIYRLRIKSDSIECNADFIVND